MLGNGATLIGPAPINGSLPPRTAPLHRKNLVAQAPKKSLNSAAMGIGSLDALITLEGSLRAVCSRGRCYGGCRRGQIAVLLGGSSSQHFFLTDSAFVICAIGHGSDQDSAPTLARSRHEIGQLLLTFLDSLQLFRHGIAVVDGIVPRIDQQRTACRTTGKQDRDEHTKTLADTVDIRHDQSMATRDVKTWAPIAI